MKIYTTILFVSIKISQCNDRSFDPFNVNLVRHIEKARLTERWHLVVVRIKPLCEIERSCCCDEKNADQSLIHVS